MLFVVVVVVEGEFLIFVQNLVKANLELIATSLEFTTSCT